jgi:hypothetical protein
LPFLKLGGFGGLNSGNR